MYEKLIRGGKVAVLYSPGYGAGWYTWNEGHSDARGLVFDKELVQAVLDENIDLAIEIAKRKYPDCYTGGAKDLKVAWLEEGEQFEIREYDGSERIECHGHKVWLEA
jgi:hypothetical protein